MLIAHIIVQKAPIAEMINPLETLKRFFFHSGNIPTSHHSVYWASGGIGVYTEAHRKLCWQIKVFFL